MFPVMMKEKEWQELNNVKGFQVPRELPMEFVNQYREQIEKNHDQTVERLAERGGLHPTEFCCAMYKMDLPTYFGERPMTDEQTIFALNMISLRLNEFNRED